MKAQTRSVVVVLATIAVLTAAAFAIGAQKAQFDPPVFTIKSNGKAVAVVTLLDGGFHMTSSGKSTFSGPSKDGMTEGTLTGKVTLQRKGDTQPLVVINADEVSVERRPSK